MNEQDPKNTSQFDAAKAESFLKSLFSKYSIYAWNTVLLSIGLYLIWTTISVLFNIIGFIIGMFLTFLALSEMKLFNITAFAELVMKVLRRR